MVDLEKTILKQKLGDIISFSYNMKNHSSIKIGGKVFALISPRNEKEFIKTIKVLKSLNRPFRVIGAGSNILFLNNLSNLCIIETSSMKDIISSVKTQKVSCLCGARLSSVYKSAMGIGLSGFERLALIPGTVGGAIVNNAGAFGVEISDILESVKVVSKNGRVKVLKAKDLNLRYRDSNLKNSNYFIISATFKLVRLAPSVIRSLALEFAKKREQTQPVGLSIGSVFKKTSGVSAGKLIEEAGLKGYRIGDCVVSNKHANFILNVGNAKAQDYKRLVQHIQKVIKKKFKIDLEREVEYI